MYEKFSNCSLSTNPTQGRGTRVYIIANSAVLVKANLVGGVKPDRSKYAQICNKNLIKKRETVRQVKRTRGRCVPPADHGPPGGGTLGLSVPGPPGGGTHGLSVPPADRGPPGGTHGRCVRNAPDLKAKEDRSSRCHSSKQSEGYYSEDNSTTGTFNMALESLGKTELEPIISSNSNGGNRIKIQLKVDLINCLIFNLPWQIRLK